MSEPKTTQKPAREQFKVVENTFQNMMRAWNDVTLATFDMTCDMVEKNMHYTQEARAQADRAMHDAMAIYRHMYQDGVKTWQHYVTSINDSVTRMN